MPMLSKNAFLTNDLDAPVSIIRIIGCLPTDVLQHRGSSSLQELGFGHRSRMKALAISVFTLGRLE